MALPARSQVEGGGAREAGRTANMHDGDQTDGPPTGFVGWYIAIMKGIGATMMGAILVIMVVQVIARYVFNASLIWAEELCRYILIWITFLFIGLAYHRGELVTVDAITMRLTPRAQYLLKAVVTIPVLIFLWLMVTNSHAFFGRFAVQTIPAMDFIWQALGIGESANISILWVYYSVTIGSALLIAHIVVALLVDGRDLLLPRGGP
jgi:TRAP-type C4-dicarboxylate transport system permease small subunit